MDFDFELSDDFGGFFFMPMIIGIIIFVFITAVIIIAIVKSVTRHREVSKGIGGIFSKSIDLANQQLDEQLNSNKPEICEYCGSLIPKDKNVCESCGAKRRAK